MLYMATGKPAHLGCKFLLDVSVVNSPVITNNSTTIGLFTTDIHVSDKNLKPKVSVLQISFLVTGHYGVRAKIPTKTTYTYDMRSSPLSDSALSL